MAIAALVSALAGLLVSCGLLSPLGIIFGHISLSQIKRTGESGRGMAIAGLVIGYLSLAGIALMVISIVATSSSA
jgi:peptidyl-prolyl cis-trans isomerase B (cyclophilin B)